MRRVMAWSLAGLLLSAMPIASGAQAEEATSLISGEKAVAIAAGLVAGGVIGSYLNSATIAGAALGAAVAAWWYDARSAPPGLLPKRLAGPAAPPPLQPIGLALRDSAGAGRR